MIGADESMELWSSGIARSYAPGAAPWLVPAGVSPTESAAHAHGWAEPGLGSTDELESDLLIETLGGARGDLQTRGAGSCCACGGVLDESTTDACVHVVWRDEQPVELMDVLVGWDHDREADQRRVAGDRNPHPAPIDEALRQLDGVRVRGKLFAIGVPDVRGSTLQFLQSTRFGRGRVSERSHG